ncbi:MAG: DUF1361 domain-containing protein [Bacteroidetes bacterium]|nr:MAG: DUF1361 domain-containing protein [Bacteroidota bacterium]
MTLLTTLKSSGRISELTLLGTFSLLCTALSLFRVYYTQSFGYLFLNWNLFLAFVPWAISTLFILYPRTQKSKWKVGFMAATWVLFFPNAPYILTDLFHLSLHSAMPIWYDLVLILSFAWTGLLFGIMSLRDIQKILAVRISPLVIKALTVFFLFTSAFGIYIGRYLRWNSWDILHHPSALFADLLQRVAHPTEHPRTWGMTITLGIFLNIVYWTFTHLRAEKKL